MQCQCRSRARASLRNRHHGPSIMGFEDQVEQSLPGPPPLRVKLQRVNDRAETRLRQPAQGHDVDRRPRRERPRCSRAADQRYELGTRAVLRLRGSRNGWDGRLEAVRLRAREPRGVGLMVSCATALRSRYGFGFRLGSAPFALASSMTNWSDWTALIISNPATRDNSEANTLRKAIKLKRAQIKNNSGRPKGPIGLAPGG